MKWRFLRLDWKYAIGELIIVTAGVLLALGVDKWRQQQANGALELEYASRLKADLREDITRFKHFDEIEFYSKRKVLEAFANMDPDSRSFDGSIINTQNLDYSNYNSLPETHSATFREMEGSGNLRLLQNQSVRVAIDDYYEFHKLLSGILADPVGEYEKIFAETMPGVAWLNSRINEEDLPDTELKKGLRNLASHPGFKAAINAELYYTAAMVFYLRQIRQKGEALLATVEAAYPDNQ
jgi:hypothetical protein